MMSTHHLFCDTEEILASKGKCLDHVEDEFARKARRHTASVRPSRALMLVAYAASGAVMSAVVTYVATHGLPV